jgi:hypothetical protein
MSVFFSIFTIHVSGFITIMKVDMARNCVLSLIDERGERASGPVVGLEAATLLLRSSTPGSHKKNPLAVSPFEDVPACGNGAAQPGGCGSGRRPRLRCRPWVRLRFGGFLGLASRVLLCMTIPLGRSFPSRPSFF